MTAKGAIRFLRAQAAEYRIDPERIGLWGASAGGHLAALVGVSAESRSWRRGRRQPRVSSHVQAVCILCGPSDLLLYFRLGGRKKHGMVMGLVDELLGGPLGRRRRLAALANPLTLITGQAPPFLIVHGDQDHLVPRQHGVALHEALRKAGVESRLRLVEGMGHCLGGPEIDVAVDGFFARHLK